MPMHYARGIFRSSEKANAKSGETDGEIIMVEKRVFSAIKISPSASPFSLFLSNHMIHRILPSKADFDVFSMNIQLEQCCMVLSLTPTHCQDSVETSLVD
jgi:hypothetical protein